MIDSNRQLIKMKNQPRMFQNRFKGIYDFRGIMDKAIRLKSEECKQLSGKGYTRKDLAKAVGISHSVCRQVLTLAKSASRNLIIRICIELNLSIVETNNCLRSLLKNELCSYIERDKIIINGILNNNKLEDIDNMLKKGRFSTLTENERRPNDYLQNNVANYPIIEENIDVSIFSYMYDDLKSLEVIYNPAYIKCNENMIINYNDKRCKLVVRNEIVISGGNVSEYNYQVFSDEDETKLEKGFYSLAECDSDLMYYFQKLEYETQMKLNDYLCMLNDTKNYSFRTAARVKNDSLEVYGETFNYFHPELNEYYQVFSYCNKIRVTKTNTSVFMQLYLQEKYTEYFGNPEVNYNLVNNQVNMKIKEKVSYSESLTIKCINHLIDEINNIKSKMKSGEIAIYKNTFNIDELIEIYKCTEIFDFYVTLDGTINLKEEVKLDNGISINLVDLEKGFALGIDNFNELVSLKRKLGDINKIYD